MNGKEEEIIEDIKVEDTPTKEKPEGINEEDLTKDMPDSSGKKPNDGPGVVRKAMEKLGILKPEVSESEEGTDIPEAFTQAAIKAGWTEEDIVDFATGREDKELLDLATILVDEPEPEPEVKPPAKVEGTPKPPEKKEESREDLLKTLKEEIRKEFQSELDALKEKQKVVDEATEAQASQELLAIVNGAFDEAGKQFEVFGQTKELPTFPAGPRKGQYVPTSPQVKARSEVWKRAEKFILAGVDVKEAMQDALDWYKGKNLESDVKRNLIKELKKGESKLSAKRTSKETTPTFDDEDERKADFIKKECERLGIKIVE